MSASLVGSEMCIRDRFASAGATRAGRSSTPSGSTSCASRLGVSEAAGTPCLLYTSDAADDM
eukprot:11865888-Alexandrium_andersonii.AAC.1